MEYFLEMSPAYKYTDDFQKLETCLGNFSKNIESYFTLENLDNFLTIFFQKFAIFHGLSVSKVTLLKGIFTCFTIALIITRENDFKTLTES